MCEAVVVVYLSSSMCEAAVVSSMREGLLLCRSGVGCFLLWSSSAFMCCATSTIGPSGGRTRAARCLLLCRGRAGLQDGSTEECAVSVTSVQGAAPACDTRVVNAAGLASDHQARHRVLPLFITEAGGGVTTRRASRWRHCWRCRAATFVSSAPCTRTCPEPASFGARRPRGPRVDRPRRLSGGVTASKRHAIAPAPLVTALRTGCAVVGVQALRHSGANKRTGVARGEG
jgi:hypothetical protein